MNDRRTLAVLDNITAEQNNTPFGAEGVKMDGDHFFFLFPS